MLATQKKNRNAKAELNRRSQVCEVLTDTGIRVAEMVGHEREAILWILAVLAKAG
jgi:hypothetical protein